MVGRREQGRGKGEAEKETVTILREGDNKDLRRGNRLKR